MAEKNEKLKTKSPEKEVEFMGVKLKPNNLTNVHLKRIVVNMCESDYRFRCEDYDDHERTRWNDEPWREKYHEEYREYNKYADYDDSYKDVEGSHGGDKRNWSDYVCMYDV